MTEQEYIELTQPYIDACQNIMTRLETLNKDYRRNNRDYPIHNLQYRIKSRQSIDDKIKRMMLTDEIQNIKMNMMDIAGIRVICYFVGDIYASVQAIKRQKDLIVIKECDYINKPKSNGYRSYHIVLGTPVYYASDMAYFPVEIQLRTMSMDFWASMEHRISYKKNPSDKDKLTKEFYQYARQLKRIERNFEKHYDNS